jgi:hypothetical protein
MKKTFKTAEDVAKDKVFKKLLAKKIEGLITDRVNRKAPENGRRFKRDFYDRIGLENFNLEYFLKNMPDVWNKTSQLGREERRVIQFVCTESLKETFAVYKEKGAKKEAKK